MIRRLPPLLQLPPLSLRGIAEAIPKPKHAQQAKTGFADIASIGLETAYRWKGVEIEP